MTYKTSFIKKKSSKTRLHPLENNNLYARHNEMRHISQMCSYQNKNVNPSSPYVWRTLYVDNCPLKQ